jgi:hypothetical protein
MAEGQAGLDDQHVRRHGRVGGAGIDAEETAGGKDAPQVPGCVGRGDEQEGPGLGRQAADLGGEPLLELAADREGHRGRCLDAELRRAQPRTELDQGQRVALGLGDDAFRYPGVQGTDHAGEQRRTIPEVQALQPHLGHTAEIGLITFGGSDGDEHTDRIRLQPSGGEGDRLG